MSWLWYNEQRKWKTFGSVSIQNCAKTIDERCQKERKESRRGHLRNVGEHRFQICPITCSAERSVWGVHQTRMLMSHPLIELFRWVGSLVALEVGDWNSSSDLRLCNFIQFGFVDRPMSISKKDDSINIQNVEPIGHRVEQSLVFALSNTIIFNIKVRKPSTSYNVWLNNCKLIFFSHIVIPKRLSLRDRCWGSITMNNNTAGMTWIWNRLLRDIPLTILRVLLHTLLHIKITKRMSDHFNILWKKKSYDSIQWKCINIFYIYPNPIIITRMAKANSFLLIN